MEQNRKLKAFLYPSKDDKPKVRELYTTGLQIPLMGGSQQRKFGEWN